MLTTAFTWKRDMGPAPVRALTYHRFGVAVRDPFCVAPKAFELQMRELARRKLAISLDQLTAFLAGEIELPRNAVLVTVDDGFRSLRTHALPILREFAIPAVAFVSTGLIRSTDQDKTDRPAPEEYLSWSDLEYLAGQGVSIQSHGITHRSLARLPLQDARLELVGSKQLLEQRLHVIVSTFAYPYGTRADFNSAVARLSGEAGYRFAFTSQHGAIRRHGELHTLPRTKVESGETLATFLSLVQGGLDAWQWIDQGLWRVQASRGVHA
jgi:peptidoglycan/xylan/chitin deacetylase (PgdA/CDA1 family)